mgnify:CR=1 FL=1|tara:strand:- start:615 stop:1946 length:1332 start_codon:yes stop_codon:yes gene_type:complete
MENDQEAVKTDIGEWLDKDDMFYRTGDKAYFLEAVNAILHNNQGAVILSDDETILDYYSRLMVTRLKEVQNFDLEVLLPSTTESLLKRFNRLMSKMSLDDALRPAKTDSHVTLMIVNDAHLIDPQQWALVSQLIGDFPGVNVRLVAFINSNEYTDYGEILSFFDKHLFRWMLEKPSLQEIEALKSVTRNTKFADTAGKLLDELSFNEIDSESFKAVDEVTLTKIVEDEAVVNDAGNDVLQNAVNLASTNLKARADGMRNRFSYLAPVCLILLGALSVFFTLNPHHAEYLLDHAPSFDIIDTEAEFVGEAEQNIFNKSQAARMNQVTPDLPVLAINNLEITNKEASASKPAPSKIIINADPDSYFIQFNLFKERITAEEYRGENDALATALLVDIKRDKENIYGIISGPFPTKEKAEKFVSVPGMPKDYWIRTAQTLQAVITSG